MKYKVYAPTPRTPHAERVFGIYDAENESEALDMMARDRGFKDWADAGQKSSMYTPGLTKIKAVAVDPDNE